MVLRELGTVKNCTATGVNRVHLNRTYEHVSRGRFGQDNRIYGQYKQSDTDDLRRYFDMHDSTRGRGRTRPEYLVNKRCPIETKVPGIRVVTRVQLFSIRHYERAFTAVPSYSNESDFRLIGCSNLVIDESLNVTKYQKKKRERMILIRRIQFYHFCKSEYTGRC